MAGISRESIINPILKGFNPDPSIICVGEDYYIATSNFEWDISMFSGSICNNRPPISRSLFFKQKAYICGWSAHLQESGHDFHRFVYVIEKCLIPRAQVIQPFFPLWCAPNVVLWAAPIAHKAHLTLLAVARQAIAFVQSKFDLLVPADHCKHILLLDIA